MMAYYYDEVSEWCVIFIQTFLLGVEQILFYIMDVFLFHVLTCSNIWTKSVLHIYILLYTQNLKSAQKHDE